MGNVLLTHESLTWAKQNKHEVICMKLDFAKAYDATAWEFMFQAMTIIGIHPTFIHMTRVLFQKANAVVDING